MNGAKTPKAGPTALGGIRITHPERVLFPDAGVTKLDLAEYHESVADWILPHVACRPLSLVRCPDGNEGECFYQKHWKETLPPAIHFVTIRDNSGPEKYVQIEDLEGLISLAQISVLEIHPWGCRSDQIEKPDRIVIDLDPGPQVAWPLVVQGALEVRALLEELGLKSFARTSGGKGLHVVVPLSRRNSWEEVETFAYHIAAGMALQGSDRYVANMRKALREGRIYVDYLRNQRGATAVASYSTRSRPGCPIATPLAWEELKRIQSGSQFTIKTLPSRLKKLQQDPWEGLRSVRQSLTRTIQKQAAAFAAEPDPS